MTGKRYDSWNFSEGRRYVGNTLILWHLRLWRCPSLTTSSSLLSSCKLNQITGFLSRVLSLSLKYLSSTWWKLLCLLISVFLCDVSNQSTSSSRGRVPSSQRSLRKDSQTPVWEGTHLGIKRLGSKTDFNQSDFGPSVAHFSNLWAYPIWRWQLLI